MRTETVGEVTGRLVDPVARSVRPARLSIVAGRIADIRPASPGDCRGWILPGFVDAHVHVESSLLPPAEFARMAVAHGTVATISDPHEIANVLGVAGVEFMLDDARGSPFRFHFGAPSCVPATPFDRSGDRLDADAVAGLLDRPEIGSLAEVMNYPGVVAGDPEVLAKLAAARIRGKPIDGHAPGLRGTELAAYVAAGISTDHECVAADEALEKLALGMRILIREGSAARNFDALAELVDSHPGRCMFCSDDKHPDALVAGHIDTLVRRALARGSDLFDVVAVASVNPVRHYGLDVGLLQRGDRADFIEIDDLATIRVRRVVMDGRVAAIDGVSTWPRIPSATPNRFAALPRPVADFTIPAPPASAGRPLRVIGVRDGQLVTDERRLPARVVGDALMPDPTADLLLLALVDRYTPRPPSLAFVTGFGLRRGALASSVAHDSHSILAVGTSAELLARAVNAVIDARGGLAVADDDSVDLLPLPIAGLMSDRPGMEVAGAYAALDRRAKDLGSPLGAPFMTLSFLALLVIPALKLGPDGLFDVGRFSPTPLFDD